MRGWLQTMRGLMRHRGVGGFLVSTFALGLGFAFVAPFLSLWGTRAVGFSSLQIGLFMTATSLAGISVSTLLARLSDTRIPRKALLLAGSLGGALGYAGYALVRDPVLLVVIGITGIALASVCFSQLFAAARDWFDSTSAGGERSVALSVVRVCFSVAWTAGPAAGAMMLAQFGFEGLFLGAAALYLAFGLGVLWFVPNVPRPAASTVAIRQPAWRTLRRPDLLGYFACFVAVFGAFSMNMMNLPIAVTQELGGSTRQLGLILGVGPLVEIPLMLWFGHLAGRGHQLRLIRLGGVSTTAYFLLLCFVQVPWHVAWVQVLSGISFAILGNIAIVFFQDLVPGQAGLATTIFTNAASVGNLVGYLGYGALAGSLGPRGLFVAGTVAAATACIGLALLRPRHEPVVLAGQADAPPTPGQDRAPVPTSGGDSAPA